MTDSKDSSSAAGKPEDAASTADRTGVSQKNTPRKRGNNRSKHNSSGASTHTKSTKTKFVGRTPELGNHILSMGSNKSQLYNKLKREFLIYAGIEYGEEVLKALNTLTPFVMRELPPPKKPNPNYDATVATSDTNLVLIDKTDNDFSVLDRMMLQGRVKKFLEAEEKSEKNMHKAFHVLIGQCDDDVVQELNTCDEWPTLDSTHDPILLLKSLQRISFDCKQEQFPVVAELTSMMKLFKMRQGKDESLTAVLERYDDLLDVADSCGASIVGDGVRNYVANKQEKMNYSKCSPAQQLALGPAIKNLSQATLFLMLAGGPQADAIRKELANEFVKGHDNYPSNMTAVRKYIASYKPPTAAAPVAATKSAPIESLTFAQQSQTAYDRKPPPDHSKVTCHNPKCGQMGHYANSPECPIRQQEMADAAKYQEIKSKQKAPSTAEEKSAKKKATGATPVSGANFLLMGLEDGAFDDEPMARTHSMFCQLGSTVSAVDAAIADASAAGQRQDDRWNHKGARLDDDNDIENNRYSTNVLSQLSNGRTININWCLLDNQSTCDIFHNADFLTNIRPAADGREMHIHCNAGILVVTMVGDLEGYGTVWYHPDAIANILSLSNVSTKNLVTFNSRDGQGFVVHGETQQHFIQSAPGLYYRDMSTQPHHANTLAGDGIDTVEKNESKYSTRDIARAKQARKLQEITGMSLRGFLDAIDNKSFLNNPITRTDIIMAEDIYGPCVPHLKGKTVWRTGEAPLTEVSEVPEAILSKYGKIVLAADIIFVNGVRFFTTVSRHLKFRTGQYIADATAETLLACLVAIAAVYTNRGFTIQQVNMDGQFKCVKDKALEEKIPLNISAEDEHVKEIERSNRTVKERVRGTISQLPFSKLPIRVIIGIVIGCILWLNVVPAKHGVSATLSPRTIMTGKQWDYNKHCQVQAGEYTQTHERHDNSMKVRTVGAIALYPTGNDEGSVAYMSLYSGRELNRNRSTPLPMTADVIARIDVLAARMPEGLTFGDRNNNPADTDDDSLDEYPDDESNHAHNGAPVDPTFAFSADDDDDVSAADASVSTSSSNTTDAAAFDVVTVGANEEELEEASEEELEEEELEEADVPTDTEDDEPGVLTVADDDDPANTAGVVGAGASIGANANAETVGADATIGADANSSPERGRGFRTRNKINYSDMSSANHLKTVGYSNLLSGVSATNKKKAIKGFVHAMHAINEYNKPSPSIINHTILSQHSLKKGLRLFGQAGAEAVTKEMKQLHDRGVLEPKLATELTREQRTRALAYLMFLKMKRDGSIKGRGCADGRKQRDWMTKEETSSPTVSTQALMLSCMIDAFEGRDVATADIPAAFLQTEYTKGDTHIRIEGPMLELLTELDPGLYRKYIKTYPNGKKVLFAEIKKAIYGTTNASLLFWLKLSASLKDMGFVRNPYDWCVMNKMIDGKQCTILWHVDDLKISHMDPAVVTAMLELIDTDYGTITPLTVKRGQVHEYLGMTIDYSCEGKVKFTMIDYIDKFLQELPDDMRGHAATPAANHLFENDIEDPTLLDKAEAELFHHRTAKLLYLSKRARPDIQLPIAYLCTRVREPNTDDHKKLVRLTKYLDDTIGIPLILAMDGTNKIRWHVDAAFAVHNDMKSHTGATMTMGQGAASSQSSKQKLNTKSSTEAEFVGVDDIMPQVIWTRYFLEAQGETVEDNIVYQDNQSAMKLEKYGMRSSGKRTRHINIRYYFVTDRIANDEMSVEYCPTEDMIGDYFTKSLQGSQFRRFRNAIMGIDEVDIPRYNSEARAMLKKKKEALSIV